MTHLINSLTLKKGKTIFFFFLSDRIAENSFVVYAIIFHPVLSLKSELLGQKTTCQL